MARRRFDEGGNPGSPVRQIHLRRAVVLRDDGRSEFVWLMTKRGGFMASLIAFDLLRLDGEDWRERPIEKRRETLARLTAAADGVVFNEALAADAAVVFAKVETRDRVEAGGQPLSEQKKPQLTGNEGEFRQDVIAMPRGGALVSLWG
jgi:hypothetical protein